MPVDTAALTEPAVRRDLRSLVTDNLRPILEHRSVRFSVVGTLLVGASLLSLASRPSEVDFSWMFVVPVAICAIAGGLREGLVAAFAAAALGALYASATAGSFDASYALSVLTARFALYGITAGFLGVFADAHHSVQMQLRELASLDPLTKVSNVTSFYEKLGVLQAGSVGFSMLLLDIDELKSLNDSHGHQAGSEAIRTVADVVRGVVRAGDCIARYGGDEFVVTLRESGREGAEIVARRIEEMLAGESLAHAPGRRIGVSIGIAVFGEDGTSAEELLSAADANMYFAKRSRKMSVRAGGTTRL